jgi:hypothetical protein
VTVLVAYVPTRQGDAAFTAALGEAVRRRVRLLVVNTRAGTPVSAEIAGPDLVCLDAFLAGMRRS